ATATSSGDDSASTTAQPGAASTTDPGGDSASTDSTDSTETTDSTGSPTSTDPDQTTPSTLAPTGPSAGPVALSAQWTLRTNASREVPPLFPVPEQTSLLTADLDGDGIDDIIVGGRRGQNAVQWLQRVDDSWTVRLIEPDELGIEAGGVTHDIDGDGDIDIVFGGDFSSNEVWWWENPSPNFDVDRWARRTIKNSGGSQHHDMLVADLDGNGVDELVFWNQQAEPPTLFAAELPADPTAVDSWERRVLWEVDDRYEGLDGLDVNDDGDIDLLAGGRLLLNNGAGEFDTVIIAEDLAGGRAKMAQLVPGGAPELIFDSGDGIGQLAWFRWNGEIWERNVLLETSRLGHSLDVADADGDGDIDILSAEMRLDAADDARLQLFVNNGDGTFTAEVLARGLDNHESRFADIDGDGDTDIVGKPFDWFTPRLDIWENNDGSALAVDWVRVVIDSARPDQALFVLPGDFDGDGDQDLVSGPNLLVNPGAVDGPWERILIGEGLNQAVLVFDIDEDGDLDIVGTAGIGSEANAGLVWARNDGGAFTLFDNIEQGTGDFIQGAAAGRFSDDGPLLFLASWHEADQGVQGYAIPDGEADSAEWIFRLVSEESQDEAISLGDIDLDGDLDVMMGTRWIRNDTNDGAVFTLHEPVTGEPDRNVLVDMDGDGDLDVVVSYEDAVNGRVAWYEQGTDPTAIWTEHFVANLTMGLSLDVADIDGDGDLDIVVGEHSTSDSTAMSLLLFENAGDNDTWVEGQIFVGDEHHDGTQLVDIDNDGDLDIVSIGWTHGRTVVYLNPRM
ncbi:MAG: VCBS repeat-containing protein, partial [Actinobacteria bacterium]|nr:VCBS repeat-containing protein [Actinomycetota bacterium]